MSDDATLTTPILVVTLVSLAVTALLSSLKIRKLWRERKGTPTIEDPNPPRTRLVEKDHNRLYKVHKNMETLLAHFQLDRASVS